MTERTTDTTTAADKKPAAPANSKSGKELGDDALKDVAGGLNPQPLPPGHVMPT